MKVVVFIKATKESEAGAMPSTELLTAMGEYNQRLLDAGILVAGEGLKPSSSAVRVTLSSAGSVVTDGPFIETKELVAGYWIWKVESMAQAVEWAKQCPHPAGESNELEIRPIFEADDFGEEFTPELKEAEERMREELEG